MRTLPILVAAAAIAVGAAPLAATASERHLLLVTGIGGLERYETLFTRWGRELLEAATGRLGIAPERAIWLAEHPADDPERIAGPSTRAGVEAALAGLGERSRPGDLVLVILVGHGTARDGRARFNLPGPDLEPEDLARALAPLAGREVVVIDAAPASAPFAGALAGPGRAIVTATATEAEHLHTRFAEPLIDALGGPAADVDRDGRLTLLEVFEHVRRGVERSYERERRLQTEHPLLEADGDGAGTREPEPTSGDGARARRIELTALAPPGSDPARLALEREARDLVERIEALRRRKPALPVAEYRRALERLLVELALNRRRLPPGGDS